MRTCATAIVMAEGGRIDHALHGSHDALQATIDKVKTFDPDLKDTLIVVTADHDHAVAFSGRSGCCPRTAATPCTPVRAPRWATST